MDAATARRRAVACDAVLRDSGDLAVVMQRYLTHAHGKRRDYGDSTGA